MPEALQLPDDLQRGLILLSMHGQEHLWIENFRGLPKEKITIVLMQQRKDSGTIPLTRKLRNVALADLLG